MALQLLAAGAEDLSAEERDLLTTEDYWITELSIELGIPRTELLMRMSSRDYTAYRARSLIRVAQDRIRAAHAARRASASRRHR